MVRLVGPGVICGVNGDVRDPVRPGRGSVLSQLEDWKSRWSGSIGVAASPAGSSELVTGTGIGGGPDYRKKTGPKGPDASRAGKTTRRRSSPPRITGARIFALRFEMVNKERCNFPLEERAIYRSGRLPLFLESIS